MGWGWVRACVPSRPAPPHHRRLACYLLPATCCLLLAACYLLLALLAACCLLLAAAASCCLLLLFAASPDAYCCCLCCRLPPSPTRSSLFPFRCSESLSCLRCDGPAMRQGRPAASDLRDVVGIPRQLRGLITSPWVHHEHASFLWPRNTAYPRAPRLLHATSNAVMLNSPKNLCRYHSRPWTK